MKKQVNLKLYLTVISLALIFLAIILAFTLSTHSVVPRLVLLTAAITEGISIIIEHKYNKNKLNIPLLSFVIISIIILIFSSFV